MYNAGEYDYDPGPYYVTILAGDVEIPFIASINDDDVYESNETFQLVINHTTLPSRISRAEPYSSTVNIINDEERKCFLDIISKCIHISINTHKHIKIYLRIG